MKVEIRNNSVVLDGYVNAVGRESRVLPSARGKFIEQIEPRTFDKALGRTNNVDLLFNHKEDRKLGSTSSGELTLYEDSIGLRAVCTVMDEEIIRKAKNNELRGWSFGFICREDKWVDGDIQKRFISDMDLLEVSILDMTPAYIATSIESRGDESVIREQRFDTFDTRDFVNEDESKEDPAEEATETEQDELVEESVEAPDFTLIEKTIEYLKILGGIN